MSEPLLRLYQRTGCHLCEDMLQQLERLRLEIPFRLELVDVDADPGHREDYGARIPVLETEQGQEISEYFLDEQGVRDYLSGSGNGV